MPAALIALLYAGLRIFLLANVVGFIVRVLFAFGLNIVLVTPAIETVMSLMTGQFNILPQVASDWIRFFHVHSYVGLILSAYTISASANFVLRINR